MRGVPQRRRRDDIRGKVGRRQGVDLGGGEGDIRGKVGRRQGVDLGGGEGEEERASSPGSRKGARPARYEGEAAGDRADARPACG